MTNSQVLLEAWFLVRRNWLGVLEAAGMGALLLLWAAWMGAMAGMFIIYL